MTVREVISKLRDIDQAIMTAEMEVNDGLNKDVLIELLNEYSELIQKAKVDI